jgi:hypothetical protein
MFLFTISYLVASFLVISQLSYTGQAVFPTLTQYWWFIYGSVPFSPEANKWSLGVGFLVLVFSLFGCYQLKNIYKRISSPEILFYIFFIFSFSLETFRIWSAFLLLKNFHYSYSLGVVFSRVVYLGRFFGLLSLLMSSLYSFDINYHKYNLILLIIFLIAFTLAFVAPFDSSIVLSNFLFKLGDEIGIALISMSLALFALVTFLVAGFKKNNNDYILIAIATLIILIGRELLLFSLTPLVIILGVFAFIAGLFMFRYFVDKPFF